MSTTPTKVMLAFAGTVLLGGMGSAMAAVTPLAWYHLGEADGIPAGPPPILANIQTQDSVGSNDLTPSAMTPGSGPWYDHPGYSPLTPGSTHFVAFDSSQQNYYHSATSVPTGTVNWGAEAWVWSGGAQDQTVLCNGRSTSHPGTYPPDTANGFVIFQYQGNFRGLLNSVDFVGSSPVVTNQWVHLALVNTNGLTTFYVNGVSAGSANANAIAPFDGLTLAAGQAGDSGIPGSGGFSGFWSSGLDEVRFFTFEQGAFSTSDLLYPTVPEPAALSLLALALLGLWRRRA